VISAIDRAHRVLSGTSLGTVVVGLETNRLRFFFVFCRFSAVFWVFEDQGRWYGGK
jgi:hypothetical protein